MLFLPGCLIKLNQRSTIEWDLPNKLTKLYFKNALFELNFILRVQTKIELAENCSVNHSIIQKSCLELKSNFKIESVHKLETNSKLSITYICEYPVHTASTIGTIFFSKKFSNLQMTLLSRKLRPRCIDFEILISLSFVYSLRTARSA